MTIRQLLTLLSIFISFYLYSQDDDLLRKAIREEIKYIDCNVKLYNGSIEKLDSLTFRFNDRVIINTQGSEIINTILGKGLIYPDLFSVININDQIYIVQNDSSDLDTSGVIVVDSGQITFDQFVNMDSLKLCDFREVRSIFESNDVRTFKFLVFRSGFANPTVYFIELKNIYAKKDTDSLDFIRGARLCKIWSSSILI